MVEQKCEENTGIYSKISYRVDLEYDQMALKEYIDPFTGEPVKT